MNGWNNIINSAREAGYTGGDSDFAAVKAFVKRNFSEVRSDGRILDDAELKALHDDYLNVKARELEDELLGGGRKARTDSPELKAARSRAIHVGGNVGDSTDHVPTWLKSYREGKPLSTAGLSDGGFRLFAENVVTAIDARRGNTKAMARLEDAGLAPTGGFQRKGMVENTGASGGFAVAPVFNAQIHRRAVERHPWLAGVTTYQTPTNTYDRPFLDDADRSGGELGGFKLTRTGETGSITEDTAVLRSTSAVLHKAAGLVKISNELRHDAPGVEQMLLNLFGDAVALLRAEDIIRGIGSTAPKGILNGGDLFTVSAEAGQDADTIIGANILAMYARQESKRESIWLAHPGALPQLMAASIQHRTDAGTGLESAHPLIQFNGSDDFPTTLLGRPLFITEHCSLLGDVGDIISANMAAYWYYVSTEGIRIDVSEHFAFSTDETTLRVVSRDDGFVYRDTTSRDRRNYEQANFVTLAARA